MNFSLALTTYPLEFFITVLIIITLLPVAGVILVLIAWRMSLIFSPTIFSKAVQGKHCLVTGGSQGLGKGIAIELVKAGAHVTIVARGKKDPITKTSSLEKACDDLKKIKVNPDQIINYYACDLTQYAKVVEMCEKLGNAGQHPEWVICNAGSSLSGFIADELPKLSSDNSYEKGDHEWMIEQNYFSAVNVVRAVFAVARSSASESSSASTNHGVDERISGFTKKEMAHLPSKIILVGSVMSTLSFIGYSAYSGRYLYSICFLTIITSKYALRGFADALRSELKPLDIDVSLYFPGNMDTPGKRLALSYFFRF